MAQLQSFYAGTAAPLAASGAWPSRDWICPRKTCSGRNDGQQRRCRRCFALRKPDWACPIQGCRFNGERQWVVGWLDRCPREGCPGVQDQTQNFEEIECHPPAVFDGTLYSIQSPSRSQGTSTASSGAASCLDELEQSITGVCFEEQIKKILQWHGIDNIMCNMLYKDLYGEFVDATNALQALQKHYCQAREFKKRRTKAFMQGDSFDEDFHPSSDASGQHAVADYMRQLSEWNPADAVPRFADNIVDVYLVFTVPPEYSAPRTLVALELFTVSDDGQASLSLADYLTETRGKQVFMDVTLLSGGLPSKHKSHSTAHMLEVAKCLGVEAVALLYDGKEPEVEPEVAQLSRELVGVDFLRCPASAVFYYADRYSDKVIQLFEESQKELAEKDRQIAELMKALALKEAARVEG